MKKNFWILFIILFFTFSTQAQLPVNTWAHTAGYSGTDEAYTVKADGTDLYIGGTFADTIDLDPGPDTALFIGNEDAYLAKYNARGEYQWAFTLNGTGTEKIITVTIDAAHLVYIAGTFAGTVDFDPSSAISTLTSTGTLSSFFATYDRNGNLLFVKGLTSDGAVTIKGLSLDANNNIYVAGSYSGNADFDPSDAVAGRATANSQPDVFAARYQADGTYQWVITFGDTTYGDEANAIKADAAGNIYVTGYFANYIDFDPGVAEHKLISGRGSNPFIAKYDLNGNYVWAMCFTANSSSYGYAVEVDARGYVYTAGQFYGTIDLDPGDPYLPVTGDANTYFCCLTPNGQLSWGKAITSPDALVQPNILHIDSGQNIYIGGYCGFVNYNTTVDFNSSGGGALFHPYNYNGFVAKYSSAGTYQWAGLLNGGASSVWSISSNQSTELYLAGTANYGLIDYDLTANMNYLGGNPIDLFLSRYCSTSNPFQVTTPEEALTVCGTNTTTLSVSGDGPFTWYSAKGGTSLGTGTSFITPAITATDSIYVQDNSVCGAGNLTPIRIWANPIVDEPVNGYSVCHRGDITVVELTASEPDVEYSLWNITYDSLENGPSYSSYGLTFPTNPITTTTTFGIKASKSYSASTMGHSLAFDGIDDYVTAETPIYEIDNMTIEAWVHYEASNGNDNKCIVYVGDPGSVGYGLYLFDGKLSLYVTGNKSVITNMPLREWTHIALVRNAGIWSCYLNGTMLPWKSKLNPFTPYPGNGLKIGGYASGDCFDGRIDELRFWRQVRTTEDIQNSMLACMSGMEGESGCYNFETGNGTILEDVSWQNNDGTLMNMNSSTAWVSGFGCYNCTPFMSSKPVVDFGSRLEQSLTICMGDSVLVNEKQYKTGGTYYDTLSTMLDGCDSLVTTHLTVNMVNVNTVVNQNELQATETGAAYQWLNCDNTFLPVSGATAQEFTAAVSGSYAVIVTEKGCVDTSACIPVSIVTATLDSQETSLQLFPNPVSQQLTLKFTANASPGILCLLNSAGQIVYSETLSVGSFHKTIDMSAYEAGVYLLQLNTAEGMINKKLIKLE
jgi:hypothetical protein